MFPGWTMHNSPLGSIIHQLYFTDQLLTDELHPDYLPVVECKDYILNVSTLQQGLVSPLAP